MKGKGASVNIQRWKYVIVDLITTGIAFLLFDIARFHILHAHSGTLLVNFLTQPKLLWEQTLFPFAALVIYWLSGYYLMPFGKSRLQELITTFLSAIINTAIIYLSLLTNDQITHRTSNWGLILILFGLLWLIVYAGRLTLTTISIRQLTRRQWSFQTLIIGNGKTSRRMAFNLSHARTNLGYNVVGYVDIPDEESIRDGAAVFRMDDLPEICRTLDIDYIVLSPEDSNDKKILSLLYKLFPLNIPIKIAPDTLSYMTSAIHMQDIYGEPFIDLTTPSVSGCSKIVKRVSDIILSSMALILLSPLFAVMAVLIKATSKGPVIYSQERIGLHQRPFRIYKFRSMKVDAEKDGPRLSSTDDPRITSIGRVMRKYRIDEIPQFFNILKGDMSLVGPRPEREFYIRKIVELAPYYTLVHQVRPGLTSWGMVKYGYASTLEEMVRRTRFDLIYLSNMSLAVDMKILIYTFKTVFSGAGK